VTVVDRGAFERGEANPVLTPGDIVEIGRSRYCYVQGEVRAPSRVRVERGLTLLRAIALVGGLSEWADRTEIQILRETDGESRLTSHNLKKIQRGKAEDPPLRGGDVVIVNRRFF
jgi:polysaccharide export outer membrane protein